MRTRTLNDSSQASDPGGLRISDYKRERLHPGPGPLNKFWRTVWELRNPSEKLWRVRCEEHLMHGDSRAAVVVSLNPLLVAAYTDELDCVAVLEFPEEFVRDYKLALGSRLLTVNLYSTKPPAAKDLEPGPKSYGRFTNFVPFIAEFLSDDTEKIAARKQGIDESEWQRTQELGERYLREKPGRQRNGKLAQCGFPAD